MQKYLDPFRLDPRPGATSLRLTRGLVVRGLGLVHMLAFVSVWVQFKGLVGTDGLLPGVRTAVVLDRFLGAWKYLAYPSVYWVWPSDLTMHLICVAGVLLGAAVVAGFMQGPSLLALWVLYLSVFHVFQVFLGYQWDLLLIEATFLALLIAPWRRWADDAPEPAPFAMTLFRFLHLKIMFLSGLVKLMSQDPTWRDLTALTYHYWTQPLPNPLSWYAHQLPLFVDKATTLGMFAIELVLPWWFLFGRGPRVAAFVGTLVLMAGLQLTGNYGFFQLLTIVIALSLLDDEVLHRLAGVRVSSPRTVPEDAPRWEGTGYLVGTAATVWLCLNVVVLWVRFGAAPVPGVPAALETAAVTVYDRTEPFRTVNTYGLFARMTTLRPEIVLEGTLDGQAWEEIPFKYKPGDPGRVPPLVAPHQPRLDWQMWFASLQTCQDNPWLPALMRGLVDGNEDVRGLLGRDPFGGEAPVAVRAVVYAYEFPEAREAPGEWWVREGPFGEYCPMVSREGTGQ